MHISATVQNTPDNHRASVRTDGASQVVAVPAKAGGRGSGVNGGEFLMLALATCYCNDLFREAMRMQVPVETVEVVASADFDGVGLAASNIRYRAKVVSSASEAQIEALLRQTDAVAEVHNTLRAGVSVELQRLDGGVA